MCDVLKEIYSEILKEEFVFEQSKRIKLQKVIYLVEIMGIHVGDYSFSWNQNGPYSIALDNDAFRCSLETKSKTVVFTNEALSAFNKLQGIIAEKKKYDEMLWLDSIVSLHYLKYISRVARTDEEIIKELMRRSKYMDSFDENKAALYIAKKVETEM